MKIKKVKYQKGMTLKKLIDTAIWENELSLMELAKHINMSYTSLHAFQASNQIARKPRLLILSKFKPIFDGSREELIQIVDNTVKGKY